MNAKMNVVVIAVLLFAAYAVVLFLNDPFNGNDVFSYADQDNVPLAPPEKAAFADGFVYAIGFGIITAGVVFYARKNKVFESK
ncbi:MAG: hypothetical protein V1834_00545 [Candidatus Micrarchaeota archaeon]